MALPLNRFASFIFLLSFVASWLSSCTVDHPAAPTKPQSAYISPPTTNGPSGLAYAMQLGTKCFVLDAKEQFWQYDPINRSYTAKAKPPQLPELSRAGFFAIKLFTFSSADKIYLGGQSTAAIPGTTDFPVFLHVYDPTTDTWTSTNPYPGNGNPYPDNYIGFFASGRGYACSFVNGFANGSLTNQYRIYCYEYEPASSRWAKRFDTPFTLPSGLIYGNSTQSVVLNGKAYWAVNAYPAAKVGKPLSNEDKYVCIYELNPQTNELTLKLTTNPFGNGMPVSPSLQLGLSADNKIWFVTDGGFDSTSSIANQLFVYDSAVNQLSQTSASLLTSSDKALHSSVGFSVNDHLYIGLGQYSFRNGTPAGLESGFAEFNVK
ncbi:hypothetical protein FAES_3428 [Fibrella aestuarina BUZ 2]|uniref:Kelch repeat-containing protein n=1 Tax=Fibrella aestuarina BUZ 2 TaxID=1166018 RepID=I0KBD3_9BACT|nr:hypothetical protein [Fibrella aestuarina]CCH01436.1 hypothetical protein FAES_3428 [Fibrella aestuarina BUZ 2]